MISFMFEHLKPNVSLFLSQFLDSGSARSGSSHCYGHHYFCHVVIIIVVVVVAVVVLLLVVVVLLSVVIFVLFLAFNLCGQ